MKAHWENIIVPSSWYLSYCCMVALGCIYHLYSPFITTNNEGHFLNWVLIEAGSFNFPIGNSDVIPKEYSTSIEMVVGPFYSAVRQAQIVTNEESRGVDFKFGGGKLTLCSRAADVGQSNVELPIPYDGEELTIIFDPKFVADFLRIIDAGTSIKVNLIDGESPAVFETEDEYRYVVMPLAREQ